MKETTELYFAYGSNLNTDQMNSRLKRTGIEVLGMANLRNYQIVERKYADIEPADGKIVYGIIYKISKKELQKLDTHEGHPTCYERKKFKVELNGNEIEVWSYEMTPHTREERNGVSYPPVYREKCSSGAIEHGIPNVYKCFARE